MISQTTTNVTTLAWRRLDIPGHDAATLSPSGDGWDLEGAAVLVQSGVVCHLNYVVKLDAGWKTRSADRRRSWLHRHGRHKKLVGRHA